VGDPPTPSRESILEIAMNAVIGVGGEVPSGPRHFDATRPWKSVESSWPATMADLLMIDAPDGPARISGGDPPWPRGRGRQ